MNLPVWYIAECRIVVREGPTYTREAVAMASSVSEGRRAIREQFARDFASKSIKIEFLSIARENRSL